MDINYYLNQYFIDLRKNCPELTTAEIEEFSKGLTVSELTKNEVYTEEGKIQKQGAFIVEGLMRETFTDDLGNERNMNFLQENQYAFHYPTFMKREPSPFSYQCIEPTVVVNLPINHIHNAYEKIPKFEKYGRMRSEKRILLQRQRLKDFISKSAEQRYIDFVEKNPQLLQRITISHLCSYLGMERQTLTRIRKKLLAEK